MSVPADMLPGMKIELADIDPDVLEDIIGTDSYAAALEYVRRRAVGRQVWADAHNALFGIVLDSHGDYYTPAIWFSPGPPLEVLRVHCGCAARHGCEHAAALLLSAVEGGAEAAAGRPTVPPQVRRTPAWDASLEAWLPSGPEARRQPETTLAIELTLVPERPGTEPTTSRMRLVARLVQPGKHGGWIGSSLNWAKLDSYGYHPTHSAAQLQLLRELLGLYRARADRSFYYSSYSGERSIELSAVDSAGSGRCSTRRRRPGWSWYTAASWVRWSGTGRRSSASTSPGPRAAPSPSPRRSASMLPGARRSSSRCGSSAPGVTGWSTWTGTRRSGARIRPAGDSAWPGSGGASPRGCRR